MDLTTTGFLFLIVVVSGVIAVLADNLGRRVGKKRLTFLHIRPRHIANIAVAASGVVVSFFTILIVSALSQDVRTWITDGRKAIAEVGVIRGKLDTLKTEGATLQKTNADLKRTGTDLVASIQRLQTKLADQNNALENRRRQVAKLTTEVQSGSAKIHELDARVAENQIRLKENSTLLAKRQSDLTKVQGQLRLIRADLQRIKIDRNTATNEYNEINKRNLNLEAQNGQLERNVTSMTQQIADLKASTAALEQQRVMVAENLATSAKELETAQMELSRLNTELAKLRADYAQAQQFSRMVGSTFAKARQEGLTYRMGEEVIRMAVSENLSSDSALRSLQTFLSMARSSAQSRGAKGNANYASADIMDRVGTDASSQIPGDIIKRAILTQITGASTPKVLVGNSSLNAFVGEPVSLEVTVIPNPVVYKAGFILGETDIFGDRGTADVYRQVSEYISEKVSPRLKADGMIQKLGSESPFGSVSTTDILNLVDQIRKEDRRVTLKVVIRNDTKAADTVKLNFQIR